ncbi:MAG: ABC transporter permease [Chloroflexi bacterium]|nr:MAG: monosaccharide-transporting ATPase [Chloroflexi bacterium OLB13]MBC6956548.1 ABC transporter permease [Chloroflexota bacterium]MBV6437958.1 Ribose import permease protein RbsC [Anaerolineae bacterium]MDL1916143.1 ABC transporter permease [Anaerolineae bacterium CFX4]MBW7880280.1 ABC transporter permease [Anaerolineae bacterium]
MLANTPVSTDTASAPNSVLHAVRRFISKNPFVVALLLLVVTALVNRALQDNLFELRSLNRNLRTFLPAIILAVGQTIVVIGGGVDLSVGAMVSMVNAIFTVLITQESTGLEIAGVLLIGAAAGIAAGALNGFAVAYLRLQPIVTTYATSFLFSGLALLILPRPGGDIADSLQDLYRSTPFDIPFSVFVIGGLIVVWLILRSTRWAQFLYATGGKPEAAYTTGVPVNRIRFSTYVLCGLFAAIAALAYTMLTGSGNPRSGDDMTLATIVAVVLGGTRLSGGQGGVIGTIIGVIILRLFSNIVSFADVPSWWQTLVNAVIILVALAAPGIIRAVQARRSGQ